MAAPAGRFGRDLTIWLGSFLAVAACLVVYFHMPLLPLLLAGAVTLGITIIRYIRLQGKRHP